MYAELDRMLNVGVIEESSSAWSTPVVLVHRPGKVRLDIDSRKLNKVKVDNAYPMPQICGMLSRLPKAEFITSSDLKDTFQQILLGPSSNYKTTFTVPGIPLNLFVVMPFGLLDCH